MSLVCQCKPHTSRSVGKPRPPPSLLLTPLLTLCLGITAITTRADCSGSCYPSTVAAGSLASLLALEHSIAMPLESNDLVNIHCCPQDLSTLSLYLLRMPQSKIITPQLRPQPQVSGRASATTPLITCGYIGRPKEMIWIGLLVLTVAVTGAFPLRGSTKKKGRCSFPQDYTFRQVHPY